MNRTINLFYMIAVVVMFSSGCQKLDDKDESSKTILPYKWQKVILNATFSPRGGAGALVYKDKMWLIGGWNPLKKDKKYFPRACNNEVWFSSDGRTWLLSKPNTFIDDSFDAKKDWEGRHKAGYVVYKDKMCKRNGQSGRHAA